MSLENFYNFIGGDLAGLRDRLKTDERIMKYIGIFMQEPTYGMLLTSMESGDYKEAFREAHTMKGLCSNMSFSALENASSALTEALRPAATGNQVCLEDALRYLEDVKTEYSKIVNYDI